MSEIEVRSVDADEFRRVTTQEGTALPTAPGAWDQGGAYYGLSERIELGRIRMLVAYVGERAVGHMGVRVLGVPVPESYEPNPNNLSIPTANSLLRLIDDRRAKDPAATIPATALDRWRSGSPYVEEELAAANLAMLLVAPSHRDGSVLWPLVQATRETIGAIAGDKPLPMFLTVADPNPSSRLHKYLGFEVLTGDDGQPRRSSPRDYYDEYAVPHRIIPGVQDTFMGTLYVPAASSAR